MRRDQAGLLVGYGSIGRYHAPVLDAMCASLAIVDGKEEARRQAKEALPAARTAGSLAELDGQGLGRETLAVIATWGPSHAPLFHELVDRGVRHIFCEKPMANSVAEARRMVERAERERVALGVHHFIRFTRFAPALREFAATHGLGEPVALQVEGGAGCLLTNGLHWIDFASTLFGAPPRRVVSTARAKPINPRSPDLMLYGGTAIWSFDDGREAVISLNEHSSLTLSARIYFRDAVVEVDKGVERISVRRRDREAVERFPAVTRTGAAVETLLEGQLPGMRSFQEGLETALEETAAGEVVTSPAAAGEEAISSCIGALVSAREGRAIDLPIRPDSPEGREPWPIS
jgi:predicted dehydrogenase